MGKFQDLKVWQRAKDLAVYIYKVTGKGAFSKDFSLMIRYEEQLYPYPAISPKATS